MEVRYSAATFRLEVVHPFRPMLFLAKLLGALAGSSGRSVSKDSGTLVSGSSCSEVGRSPTTSGSNLSPSRHSSNKEHSPSLDAGVRSPASAGLLGLDLMTADLVKTAETLSFGPLVLQSW